MPLVDFYVLQENKQKALLFACRLLEELHNKDKSIYIHTASKEEALELDKLLWTYREDSFLPHQLYDANLQFQPNILIGYGNMHSLKEEILVNLTQEFPTFFTNFKQVIEIVFADSTIQQLARERFREYRQQGCELTTHKI